MPQDSRVSRSRSPHRSERSSHRHRSRSPRTSRKHHHEGRHSDRKHDTTNKPLPLGALPLSKHALRTHRPLLALYLDIQKELDIEDLPEDEVKGRWKSFVGKWNRGELAEGWYDPKTLEKALSAEQRPTSPTGYNGRRTSESPPRPTPIHEEDGEEDDDEFGPSLPTDLATSSIHHDSHTRHGPSDPHFSDLRARNEEAREQAEAESDQRRRDLQSERKTDRRQQRERIDELIPRAEPGTKERQLEKKREIADSNQTFAAAKEGGGDMDLREADVMGDEDSLGDLKRMKKEQERKKNDREIRREEALRARMAEREERMKGLREKEEKTMSMLKDIARARFGGGGVG